MTPLFGRRGSFRSALWAALTFVLFLTAVIVFSCSQDGRSLSTGLDILPGTQPGVVPPMGEVDVSAVTAADVAPAWSSTYGDAVLASVSSAGDYVIANITFKQAGKSIPGFQVLDRHGRVMWERRFSDKVYRYARAFSLARGKLIGAVVLDYYDKGLFYLLDKDGNEVWSPQSISGSITPFASPDGSRIAILNDTKHYLQLLTASGREIAGLSVSDRVTLRFTDDGEYLYVLDADRLIVIDSQGEHHAFAGDVADPSEIQVTPDGQYVAVTANDGVDRLNLFASDGTLKWRHTIDPGGTDKLVFSSDGRYLVLYDFGTRGGVALYRVKDGAVLWRTYFVPPDGRQSLIRSAWIRSDSLEVMVNYTESHREGRETVEDHALVIFDRQGRPESRLLLPAKVDIHGDGDGSSVVVTTNNEIQKDGTVSQKLFWYDLLALFHPTGGK